MTRFAPIHWGGRRIRLHLAPQLAPFCCSSSATQISRITPKLSPHHRSSYSSFSSSAAVEFLQNNQHTKTICSSSGGGTFFFAKCCHKDSHRSRSLRSFSTTLNNNNNNNVWISSSRLPPGFWKNIENHRAFFDWAAKQLSIDFDDNSFEGWYKITRDDINKLGGSTLLSKYYKGSIYLALSSVYPHYNWEPWKFANGVPRGFWLERANHRWFFDWIAKQFSIEKPEDWYRISYEDMCNVGGSGLLNSYYDGSLVKALISIYPEVSWMPWRHGCVPVGYWADMNNQRKFFDWAAQQLGIVTQSNTNNTKNNNNNNNSANKKNKTSSNANNGYMCLNYRNHYLEGWYDKTVDDIIRLGGASLLQRQYNGSLARALAEVYPAFPWQPWRFRRFVAASSQGGARGKGNKDDDDDDAYRYAAGPDHDNNCDFTLKSYISYLTVQLRIRDMEDWHRISPQLHLEPLGGNNIITAHGGLVSALKKVYPDYDWNAKKFVEMDARRVAQRRLITALAELFPKEEIIADFNHPKLRPFVLDVCVPFLSLGFDFGDESSRYGDTYSHQQKLDACAKLGITLINLPPVARVKHASLSGLTTLVVGHIVRHGRDDLAASKQYPALLALLGYNAQQQQAETAAATAWRKPFQHQQEQEQQQQAEKQPVLPGNMLQNVLSILINPTTATTTTNRATEEEKRSNPSTKEYAAKHSIDS